jgi:hypothetical protein
VADDESASNPGTEAFVPDFSDDTGSQPVPVAAEPKPAETKPAEPDKPVEPSPETRDFGTEAAGVPVQSVTVPGRYVYLRWWQLALVVLGVWIAAGVVGLGLFYWWYHSLDKTPAVFMALVYVAACAVGGVLLAMTEARPLISALSLAMMSGPFASIVAAAPLYGYYYCARTGHCLIGVIPY